MNFKEYIESKRLASAKKKFPKRFVNDGVRVSSVAPCKRLGVLVLCNICLTTGKELLHQRSFNLHSWLNRQVTRKWLWFSGLKHSNLKLGKMHLKRIIKKVALALQQSARGRGQGAGSRGETPYLKAGA